MMYYHFKKGSVKFAYQKENLDLIQMYHIGNLFPLHYYLLYDGLKKLCSNLLYYNLFFLIQIICSSLCYIQWDFPACNYFTQKKMFS